MIRGSKGRFPYHEGKHLIVTIELFVFGDESGIQAKAPICLVGGYIGSPRQWERLDKQWRRVLTDNEITEFKGHEFFGRENGQRVGQYAAWTDRKAALYLSQLLALVQQTAVQPLGLGVERKGFDALSVGERRYMTGGVFKPRAGRWTRLTGAPTKPYFFLMQGMMKAAVGAHLEKDARVHFVLDEQNEFEDHAERLFREIKRQLPPEEIGHVGELRFAESCKLAPLQVADMYAHLVYRMFSDSPLTNEHRVALNSLRLKRGLGLKKAGFPIFGFESLKGILERSVPADALAKLRAVES